MKDPRLASPTFALQPARVFTTSGAATMHKNMSKDGGSQNSIVVSGKAAKSVEPDLGELRVVVSSKPKSTAHEAKESVLRREDYVKQVFENFSCRSSEIEILHFLQPVSVEKSVDKSSKEGKEKTATETQYVYNSEFWVKFRRWEQTSPSVLSRMTESYNVLLEKVGADFVSVKSEPFFHLSEEQMHRTRSEVSSAAVFDARRKASQLAKSLSQENKCSMKLANHGVPSSVVEQSFKEFAPTRTSQNHASWSDLYRDAYCTVNAEFNCTFDVKISNIDRSKTKQPSNAR